MQRNVEDIIVPQRRRSIRDIPIPEGRKRVSGVSAPTPSTSEDKLQRVREVFSPPGLPSQRPKRGKSKVYLATFVAAIVLLFAALSFFSSSTLLYVAKSSSANFEGETLTADKSGDNTLLFSLVKISKDKGMEVAASGEIDATRKASGQIVVYNNASTEPQRLIATTRFETSSGVLFRAPEDFVIPGKKTVNGVSQPGSIEITVFADEGGPDSNIGLSDFTLPGLAGTARASTIYARSKTPMTGGFVGKEKMVSEADKARVSAELEAALKSELLADASADVPEGFVFIPTLSTMSIEPLPQTSSETAGSATLNLRGHLAGVMFKKSDLALQLAKRKLAISPTESVDLLDFNTLNWSLVGEVPTDLSLVEQISFTVSGPATVVWQVDEVALKTDLAGKHKSELPVILNNYPTVVSATPVLRPFWKSTFPQDSAQISVKESTE